ncbi:superkiller complex protein 3-like isoform X2 [Rhopilema esculentum]|uniref:superkiller complex protein 3-like isoform X2 n=1 Tax=Rhopilema esculentum TaxID=499914 RepID=UPI0031DDBEBC
MADSQGKAASKEITAELKAAKEEIKKKEYKEALKHCKNVLKIDKSNYHALVFIGLCAKEMEQFEQSRAAYQKAIDQNVEQLLAWQGLCNLYEAADKEEWKEDLVKTYSKLIQGSKSDMSRWKELLAKVIPLQLSLDMTSEALSNLKDLEGASSEPSMELLGHWQRGLNNLMLKLQKEDITLELQEQIENTFQSALEYSRVLGLDIEEIQEGHLKKLKQCLREIGDKEKSMFVVNRILEKGTALLHDFPTNKYALELVIRIRLEQSPEDHSDETAKLIKEFHEIDAANFVGIVGMALIEVQTQQWLSALKILKPVQGIASKDFVALYWLLMAKIHLYLYETKDSLAYIKNGMKNIGRCLTESGKEIYKQELSKCKAECFMKMRKYEEAKDILIEITQKSKTSNGLYLLGASYAYLKENKRAAEVCEHLTELQQNASGTLAIKALISMNEEKYYDAELRLQEAMELQGDISEYFYLLGKVYWQLREKGDEYWRKAHGSFLKAAKLDPFNSDIFFALGEYYRDFVADSRKAQKCFQKAVSLNELNEDAAMALGDLSMDLGDEETAVKVYEQVTRNFAAGRVKIAWLRLGLLLTKRGQAEKAVTCFRSALRSDPEDRHMWECLGDAYIARGSYMPALKAFQKAVELDPENLYSRYKMGVIKQSVCVYDEAIEEFKKVLAVEEDHIPAWRGLAESHLKTEYACIAENFDGRAVDHAAEALLAAARAIELRPDLRCLWKIMGDASFALRVVAEEKLSLQVPPSVSQIIGIKEEETGSKKKFILDLSRRCYGVVVKLEESSAAAWHDLSLSSFHYGMLLDGELGKTTMQQSVKFIKKAISLEPGNAKMWNTLGVISGSSGPSLTCCGYSVYDIANPELSQHAFIKALQLDSQNAEIWCNLGTLYLKYDKIKEAHEAFKRAQDADPEYTPAWIGQASIAEIIGDADAMDLFRHSSEMGSHTECYLAYAKWVIFSLKDYFAKQKRSTQRLGPFDLPDFVRKAIANSAVCVQKYTDRMPGNSCAHNLLGILLEHQQLFKQAETAFRRAYQLLATSEDVNKRNMVLANLARVLRRSGQFKQSIEVYLQIKPMINANDVTGLALAYFLDSQLEQSFQTYEQALGLAESERDKSDILAAIGIIGYSTGNSEIAKSFLFKSAQTSSPSERGLSALAALGLLSKDLTLTNAALAEIRKHPDFETEDVQESFTFLESSLYHLQGNFTEAKRSVQKLIRRYPGSSRQWAKLAKFFSLQTPLLSMEIAGRCAEISAVHEPSNVSSLVVAAAASGSKSFASKLDSQSPHVACLRAAQKAVHSNPGQPENWALLSAAALAKSLCSSGVATRTMAISTARLSLLKAEESLGGLEETLKTTISRQLEPKIKIAINLRVYSIKQLVWAYLNDGVYNIAMLLSENAMSEYEGHPKIWNDLQYLNVICAILLKSRNGENVDELLLAAKTLCDSESNSIWRYQVFVGICQKLGLPLLAEFALRKCIQHAVPGSPSSHSSFVRLFLSSIACYSKDKNERWITLASEALNEFAKLKPGNCLVDLLRMSLFHVQGDSKKAGKIFQRLTCQTGGTLEDLLKSWGKLYGSQQEEKIDPFDEE